MSFHQCMFRLALLTCTVSVVGCATQPRGRLFGSRTARGPALASTTLPSQQTKPVAHVPVTKEAWDKKTKAVSFEDRQPARQKRSHDAGNCAFG